MDKTNPNQEAVITLRNALDGFIRSARQTLGAIPYMTEDGPANQSGVLVAILMNRILLMPGANFRMLVANKGPTPGCDCSACRAKRENTPGGEKDQASLYDEIQRLLRAGRGSGPKL